MAPTPINFAEQAWINAAHYNNAMDTYQAFLAKNRSGANLNSLTTVVQSLFLGDAAPAPIAPVQAKPSSNNLVNKIQETRNTIKEAMAKEPESNLVTRIDSVEAENAALKEELKSLTARFAQLESRLNNMSAPAKAAVAPAAKVEEEEEEDDDIDLFGSDDEEEDAAAEKLKAERIAAYNERKSAKESKKGVLVAKSTILLDVKPWSDETDMALLEKEVRKIETDGLLWGTSKLIAVGYGIKKLQICCVVEDDKVGTDFLEEEITAIEDHVRCSFLCFIFNFHFLGPICRCRRLQQDLSTRLDSPVCQLQSDFKHFPLCCYYAFIRKIID